MSQVGTILIVAGAVLIAVGIAGVLRRPRSAAPPEPDPTPADAPQDEPPASEPE